MASAVEELKYQNPLSFDDFYRGYDPSGLNVIKNPNSLFGKFYNFFTGKVTSARQAYENYLAGVESNNNAFFAQEANKKTWQREDTEAQRKVKDYEDAGLNPYLVLSGGGSVVPGSSSQAQSGSYKRSSKSSEKEESKLASSALKILAIIALRGLMKG